jgi:DNA-binding transcriptional ArsR family regulator
MIETFTALAEPNRLRIVELLRTGPRSVGDIGSALGVRQPQVSKHLKLLKEVGLVDVEPRAQARIYGLRAAPLLALHHWLEDYRALWDERFDAFDAVLVELKERERLQRQRATTTPTTTTPTTTTPTTQGRQDRQTSKPAKPAKPAKPRTTAANKAPTTNAGAPARSPTRRRP